MEQVVVHMVILILQVEGIAIMMFMVHLQQILEEDITILIHLHHHHLVHRILTLQITHMALVVQVVQEYIYK